MIFCVEDEANIRELVVYTLETTGFEARGFEEGTSFFEALAEELPELILLDIMLPGEDGMEILKKLKTSGRTKDIPVIMVTAKGAELRRTSKKEEDDTYVLGEIRMDRKKHEVTVAGEPVALTLKEYELLRKLMENQNIVLTRDKLLEEIWGYDFDGETRTVDVHVRTLRQKLGQAGEYIETVRGVGYRIGEIDAK